MEAACSDNMSSESRPSSTVNPAAAETAHHLHNVKVSDVIISQSRAVL